MFSSSDTHNIMYHIHEYVSYKSLNHYACLMVRKMTEVCITE